MIGAVKSMGDPFSPAEQSLRANFMRELVQRLSDGCSVTFTDPQHGGKDEVANEVLRGLRERGCLTICLDLAPISSIDEFAGSLAQKYLSLLTGDIGLSGDFTEHLLTKLSEPSVKERIRDVVDGADLGQMTEWQLIDLAAEIGQQIATRLGKRLVVWIQNWEKVVELGGDLLTKRLRAIFQLQNNVSYAFVGSDTDVMTNFFADRYQAFYRFAVIMSFPGA